MTDTPDGTELTTEDREKIADTMDALLNDEPTLPAHITPRIARLERIILFQSGRTEMYSPGQYEADIRELIEEHDADEV